MKNITRVIGVSLAAASLLLGAASCSNGGGGGSSASAGATGSSSAGTSAGGSVYFLNFKPESADKYDAIIAEYKKETGVDVKVATAASGTYEQTLTSEMAKSSPPTIFQINGPVGWANWKDYTADLTNSDIYKHLNDQSLAVKTADGVWGVPYVVEGYGIIYNDAIMKKYFALADKKVSISSAQDIKSWDLLQQVVEDMTAHAADLGIKGVFSSTSLKPGEDWRWQTHLADVPLFYEFSGDKVDLTKGTPATIKFTYSDNMKNLFDLYLNNSTVKPTELGSKTVDDSMAEFALGQSAMVQNGNWGWSQVAGVQGNTVQAADVHMLPLYMGISGEEKYGIPIGTENYFSINAKADAASQKASLDFLTWLFSSDYGKKAVSNDLGFIAPFDWFKAGEGPNDPLATEVTKWMTTSGITSVPWSAFQVMPSQDWKNNFGAGLLTYAQGKADWSKVSSDMVADWAKQAAAAG
ncbi:MAG: ABC transporter substrate-binding protein [Propionibacteriaceae bacterium]|jgi:raffinose/stachyose/melibiose transport system substrate-binding protein|nr:ABC transporter substrate-binding protein [Propionibacteriaceae bacterium]